MSVLIIIYNQLQLKQNNLSSIHYHMVRAKHKVTEDIISVIFDYAKTDGREDEDYAHITDDNTRAHAILSTFQGDYQTLTQQFPTLANDYKDRKIRHEYRTYYGTALKHFKKCAEKSDPSFVVTPTATTAPTTSALLQRAPTTAPNAPPPAPTSSAEISILVQSVTTLSQTFKERDAKTAEAMLQRDAHTAEAMLQLRKEIADREAKKDEKDEKNRNSMLEGINSNAVMIKSTRDMVVHTIGEVATCKKDIETVRKECAEIRQFIEFGDSLNVNLFPDGKYKSYEI